MKLKTAYFIAGAIIISAAALPMATMANGASSTSGEGKGNIHATALGNNMVMGTVTAISGTTLTVTDAKATVYTIDASAAKVVPGGNAGLTIANILVGDKVVITGSVSGTTRTAKMISDRSMVGRNIFMGKVTAINGTTLTIESGKDKVVYTVNAGSATLLKGMGAGTAIVITDIKVGDKIFAIGTLSSTTVSATSVRDLEKTKIDKKPQMNWGKFKAGSRMHHLPGRR